MKLVVLAGAKKGAAVPIKKSSFIIGRSKECALRAGSEAISRKHCELKQVDSGVTVQDLGSRNGTYLNDERIEGVQPLSNGDTLRIGPLEFRFESEAEIRKVKAPKIKNVAEAVARVNSKGNASSDLQEDDISGWLLGSEGGDGGDPPAIGETLSMRTDETRISREKEELAKLTADAEAQSAEEEVASEEETEKEGKKKKKKEPGKLPFRPDKPQSKDSREAAEQILRDMARRR
ncbi:FHA domain-containing protein FhaB [Planctomycetes bacterium MalM25]|nr:FHA domain-containing protein FhaB [Planctomycetes bacterium MalM25]